MNKYMKISFLLSVIAIFAAHGGLSGGAIKPSVSEPEADEQIKWQVISSGGTSSTSPNYQMKGTVGQTAVGHSSSENHGMSHGFWQVFGFCDCIPGDADGSGNHNLLDATHIINYLYKEGPPPTPFATCSGDADCNCAVNLLDVTCLIDYLYKDGPAPCSCQEWVSNCSWPLNK